MLLFHVLVLLLPRAIAGVGGGLGRGAAAPASAAVVVAVVRADLVAVGSVVRALDLEREQRAASSEGGRVWS